MGNMVEGWKNRLERNKFKILYVCGMLILFISLAGWALLPDMVYMTAESMGNPAVAKNTALLLNLGLNGFFLALFTWKPRELVYFIALVMAMLVSTIPLLNMVL